MKIFLINYFKNLPSASLNASIKDQDFWHACTKWSLIIAKIILIKMAFIEPKKCQNVDYSPFQQYYKYSSSWDWLVAAKLARFNLASLVAIIWLAWWPHDRKFFLTPILGLCALCWNTYDAPLRTFSIQGLITLSSTSVYTAALILKSVSRHVISLLITPKNITVAGSLVCIDLEITTGYFVC